MKSVIFYHHARTLCSPNLSHMDFLDGPAAIQWSRMTIPCAGQDASPNEFMNPEILEINRHKNIYSFGLVLPAIFPGCVISSCVCIILLFEQVLRAMSNIHIVRQHSENASETSIWRELTASNHEILHFCMHARNLDPLQSLSYGFSQVSRCNPRKHNDIF